MPSGMTFHSIGVHVWEGMAGWKMEAKWSKHSQPDIHQLMCGLVWVLGLILTQPCAPSCSNCLAWKLDCVIVPQFRTYCWGSAKMGRIQFFTTFFEKQKKSFLQQYVVLRQSTQLRHSRKISWNLHDSLDKWWLSFFFFSDLFLSDPKSQECWDLFITSPRVRLLASSKTSHNFWFMMFFQTYAIFAPCWRWASFKNKIHQFRTGYLDLFLGIPCRNKFHQQIHSILFMVKPVSYTHLTLPTRRTV